MRRSIAAAGHGVASSAMRPFLPSPRQTNALIAIGAATLAYALYLRFWVIEAQPVASACAAGLAREICKLRLFVLALSGFQLFGGVALVAAGVHFNRPHLAAFTTALVAALLGLVLYNTGLSALAVALLVMGFARPVLLDRPPPAPAARPRTTRPASSRKFH